jgi:outer membrane cobalamin receptor
MGGVINILTRPVEKRHMEFSGRYGSQDSTMYSVKGSDLFWNRLGLTLGYQRLQTGEHPFGGGLHPLRWKSSSEMW